MPRPGPSSRNDDSSSEVRSRGRPVVLSFPHARSADGHGGSNGLHLRSGRSGRCPRGYHPGAEAVPFPAAAPPAPDPEAPPVAVRPLLRGYRRALRQFATDMISKAVMEFLSANLVEIEQRKGLLIHPTRNTPGFASYFRLKAGIAEAFALFIFSRDAYDDESTLADYLLLIPDLMVWMNHANDIFSSFYKESMVSTERDNAVYHHATAHGLAIRDCLMDYHRLAMESLARVREALETTHPRFRNDVEEFVQGYLAFHVCNPRYRLCELGLHWVTEVNKWK
ncbi:hypothetical protein VTN77DRAFT_1730 [Rasamsonia byssochlamydoides]|uniref:uncharacterized protein n=1 Tax=Rasamsonia byssochlamydoides TaxID=89139 RepID=UPI0037448FF8